MSIVNTVGDGSGRNLWQLGDQLGRTVITGPTGITTAFRFLAGASGVNPILAAPGAGLRWKISQLRVQNLNQLAGVTGIIQGSIRGDIAGTYLPPLAPTYAPVVTITEGDLMPLTLNTNEALNISLSAIGNVSGWGIAMLETF
jgi:hypothetical protein